MTTRKLLLTIQQFTGSDLMEFLKKNGCGEFEEILITEKITNGKKFMELGELDLRKWQLAPSAKRKLWQFLTELKENPEKYIKYTEEKSRRTSTLPKRPNFTGIENGFKKELENVLVPQLLHKPTRPSEHLDEPPVEEYLQMDRIVPEKPDLDDEEYLIPTENPPISNRPPQALPRGSGDYIPGPSNFFEQNNEKPPPLKPRVKEKSNVQPFQASKSQNKDVESEEEVAYEPVDESHEPITSDTQTGTLTKVFSFLKLTKKPETGSLEHLNSKKTKKSEIRSSELYNINSSPTLNKRRDDSPVTRFRKREGSSPATRFRKRGGSLISRPLPPLPNQDSNAHEENPEEYENVRQPVQNTFISQANSTPNLLYSNDAARSKSENNLLDIQRDENDASYINTDTKIVEPPRLPHSYERYCLKASSKRPLPLPPTTLPKIPILTEDNESEGEEYENYVFNLNDEPFYRNTDRKGARQLLENIGDGGFLFRPSKRFFLTLSLKYEGKIVNLGIEKQRNNKLRFDTGSDSMSPEFATLTDFVEFFTLEYLTFKHEGRVVEVLLRRLLPSDRF